MPLLHDFAFANKNDENNLYDLESQLQLDDNLILYLLDSFQWINTYWNESREKMQGLNYYGYTIFEGKNIHNLGGIVQSWCNLFIYAVEEFTLTGNFLPMKNEYEKNNFNKEEVIVQLQLLVAMCDKALSEGLVIVHMGI